MTTEASFEFSSGGRIVFGNGAFAQLGAAASGLGRQALVITGLAHGNTTEQAVELLARAGIGSVIYPVETEPTPDIVLAGVQIAARSACDLVIGIGGGSAIDAAKAAAAGLANPGDLKDHLEVVGKGTPLEHSALPCIAVPTTAGTGSEVTRNAVLSVADPNHPGREVKVSLRHVSLLPRVAIVDPELTYSLPPEATAATGMDALTQVIEPFVSNRANPLTDAICREGIMRAGRSLRKAYLDGNDRQAREDMSLAALMGGLALANARLGAVHGFAGPFGGMFHAPHGAVCARLLPVVMHANIRALRTRSDGGEYLARYAEIARILIDDPNSTAEAGAEWVAELTHEINIPPLGVWGLTEADFSAVAEGAGRASSMQGNPIRLEMDELKAILAAAI
jgi:alcohol dehydrogenase class IV